MPIEAHITGVTAPRGLVLSHRRLALGALWLLVFSGSIVKIEPSPYEAMFPFALGAFALAGLRFHRSFAVPLVLLALFNAGGLLSLIPYVTWKPAVMFVAISIYLAVTTMFFASVLLEDTEERLETIRSAFVATGVLAALLGIAGYFSDSLAFFTRHERATGAFKDPNVFGPFLVLPILWCVHRLLQNEWDQGRALRQQAGAALATLVMTFGVFLSFSRGAWGVLAGGLILVFGLTFLTTGKRSVRRRVVAVTLLGLAGLLAMLVVALSIPEVRTALEQRASLSQDYDLGPLGRFGGQMRSIPLLLESPLGFGPLRFHIVVGGEDPHNVYVNAFASYGWLGGFSYLALVVSTCIAGWLLVSRPGPYRKLAIPIWAGLFMQILQGFQIDTDHWRHFYLMLGLVWGLAAADARWRFLQRSGRSA